MLEYNRLRLQKTEFLLTYQSIRKNKRKRNQDVIANTSDVSKETTKAIVNNRLNLEGIHQSNYLQHGNNIKTMKIVIQGQSFFAQILFVQLSSKFHISGDNSTGLKEHEDSTEPNFYIHPIYKKTLLEKPIDGKFLMEFLYRNHCLMYY